MCFHQDRSARSFINTAGFHSNNTVFYNVNDSDSVFSAKFVEFCDDLRYFHFFSVQAFRNTCFKCHGDIFSFVWCFFRRNTKDKKVIVVWLTCRIFQLQPFMADMPQITVTAVAVFCIKWKINTVSFAVFDLIFTGLHGPYICHTPWSNDL